MKYTKEYFEKLIEDNNGTLDISKYQHSISILPNELVIPHNLILHKRLKKLPSNINIGGNLDFNGNTLIKEIAENVTIGGDLYIEHTCVHTITASVKIGGSVYARNSCIKNIPNNWLVNGDLDISHTHFYDIPKNLKVKGSLNMEYTSIVEIPATIRVGKDINISDCPYITKLPRKLKVKGSLYMCNTYITEIPEDIYIGKNLDITFTRIGNIPANCVKGRIINLGGMYLPFNKCLAPDYKQPKNMYMTEHSVQQIVDAYIEKIINDK